MRELGVLTWLPVGSMMGLLALSLAMPATAERIALPLAVGGALVGLPHGAVDHLATARPVRGFTVAYAAVALSALLVFLAAPTPTLVAFLVLSAAHFGRGEVVSAAERAARRAPGAHEQWTVTAAWGGAVVGLLLWAHVGEVDAYLRPLSPWLADAAADTRVPGLCIVAMMVLCGLVALLQAGRMGEAAELLLVALVFSVAPALAAFGIWFGLWHAVRHTGRLLDLAVLPQDSNWGPAARLIARASALPSLAAAVFMVALWWARDLASLQSEVAVLLALTFPHAATVWAMDRRESAGSHATRF